MPILATNRKARRNFRILDTEEAGIQLTGAEVRSIKNNQVQIHDAFVKIDKNNEAYLYNSYIAPYGPSGQSNYDPYRRRKLLLHKDEIRELKNSAKKGHLTIIPLKMYTVRRSLIKLEIALVKGKKQFEKRKSIKDDDIKKSIRRAMKR